MPLSVYGYTPADIGCSIKMAHRIFRKVQANCRKFSMICFKDNALKTLISFYRVFTDLWPSLHLQTQTYQHLSHKKLVLCNIGSWCRHMSNGVAQEKVER